MKRWFTIPTAAAIAICLAGCQNINKAQTGALGGALAGTAVGALAGHDAKGALIGAGVGTAGGYIVGNEMDKHDTNERIDQVSQDANTTVVNVHNSNGSVTPVALRRSGGNWIGPRGEVYANLPTEQQLRQVYGF